MKKVMTHVRVRYAETDQMGVVYHANYLTWFEIGRTEWIEAVGHPYAEFERKGLLLPLTEARLFYHRPARYGEDVRVVTWLSSFSAVRLTFSYEAYRDEEEGEILLAEGYTEHAWVDKSFRATPLKRHWPEMAILLQSIMKEEGS